MIGLGIWELICICSAILIVAGTALAIAFSLTASRRRDD
jgi:hypothetical protein